MRRDRHDGFSAVQPRGADFGVADGSGWGKHVPGIPVCSWRSGDVHYDVDFTVRTVAYAYYDCNGEEYLEAYPTVEVDSK